MSIPKLKSRKRNGNINKMKGILKSNSVQARRRELLFKPKMIMGRTLKREENILMTQESLQDNQKHKLKIMKSLL